MLQSTKEWQWEKNSYKPFWENWQRLPSTWRRSLPFQSHSPMARPPWTLATRTFLCLHAGHITIGTRRRPDSSENNNYMVHQVILSSSYEQLWNIVRFLMQQQMNRLYSLACVWLRVYVFFLLLFLSYKYILRLSRTATAYCSLHFSRFTVSHTSFTHFVLRSHTSFFDVQLNLCEK